MYVQSGHLPLTQQFDLEVNIDVSASMTRTLPGLFTSWERASQGARPWYGGGQVSFHVLRALGIYHSCVPPGTEQ